MDDGFGNYLPRPDYPVCLDKDIAFSMEKELTTRDGRKHFAIPFAMQSGGLLS